eukprot:137040_1
MTQQTNNAENLSRLNAIRFITPKPLHFFMEYGESKALCFEFESDGSIVGKGVEFTIDIEYDACEWTEWSECYAQDMTKVRGLDRGPFCDGRCGVGSQHRNRTATHKQVQIPNEYKGAFVDCSIITEGPQYCIIAPCENMGETDFDGNARFGRHKPYSLWWNGNGRIDPIYANPFNIHRSTSSAPYNLDAILSELEGMKAQIISEHVSETILNKSILQHEHDYSGTSKEYLGGRLLHSLLIGRPFVYAFTGSSNTAGHDNQFMNTYPQQLQARLEGLWQRIGVDGAAFTVRNVAIGGAINTKHASWWAHVVASRTFDYWNENALGNENIDVLGWESYMNDGGKPPQEWVELHVRMAASLNAIWSGLQTISGYDCEKKDHGVNRYLLKKEINYLDRMESVLSVYSEYMGIVQVDSRLGLWSYAEELCAKNDTRYAEDHIQMNWHPNARGHRLESDEFAYLLLDSVIAFIIKYRRQLDGFEGPQLDAFLMHKSGRWKDAMAQNMIAKQQQRPFPLGVFCGDYCKSIPFTLISYEPSVYNTAHRLQDYVIGNKNSAAFDDLISAIGWRLKGSNAHEFDSYGLILGRGGQQSNDMKRTYQVDAAFMDRIWSEQKMNDLDRFEAYLIERDYVMRFYVYVPKYGNASLRIFGKECKLNGNRIYLKQIHDESNGLGLRSENCVWNDLQQDSKYIISVVTVDLTQNPSNSDFNIVSGY